MGIKVEFGGKEYPLIDYSVAEASTPLAAGDSSGQVGTIDLKIPPASTENALRPETFIDSEVKLTDGNKGFTVGTVTGVNWGVGAPTVVTATSRISKLNIYNVQAQPFIGTLGQAFEYYASLAGVVTDIFVDSEIAARPVAVGGWFGELWFNLKALAAAFDCDIALVSGVILLRPIRVRDVNRGKWVSKQHIISSDNLAQLVEVYQYNYEPITNSLVYPTNGWNSEVSVITVNAGESIEEELELSASVSAIQQPEFSTSVGKNYVASSVYTVCGDDGLPITEAAWVSRGGSLSVSIGSETNKLLVKITAPTGLPNADGTEIKSYGISMASEDGTGRYSTLRIVGTGVRYDKQLVSIQTGLTSTDTGTEVGITIDNPFISTPEQAYSAGSRAARKYAGKVFTLSGTLTAVNKLGDSGEATYPTYDYVKALYAGKTYDEVQAINANKTYAEVAEEFFADVRDNFENQVFGNVSGARIWDSASRRWYRIRSAAITQDVINFEADDDLTFADVTQKHNAHGRTFADVDAMYAGKTYTEVSLLGLPE